MRATSRPLGFYNPSDLLTEALAQLMDIELLFSYWGTAQGSAHSGRKYFYFFKR
jgi:hypothetical protein